MKEWYARVRARDGEGGEGGVGEGRGWEGMDGGERGGREGRIGEGRGWEESEWRVMLV